MARASFAIARIPTPVFNTPLVSSYLGGEDGSTVALDSQQLMRCTETVLLPHTKIKCVRKVPPSWLWQIETEEYPYPGEYFAHENCLLRQLEEPPKRVIHLPSPSSMLKMAKCLTGARYIWGGNWPLGIPMLTELFPPSTPFQRLPLLTQDTWQLKGVDCSGLLYFLSDGYTPRNTSTLLHFGKPVKIKQMDLNEILEKLLPLDLIVFKGHVILVLDSQTSIESKALHGVIQTPLGERISELLQTKTPIDDSQLCTETNFVVRRWHPAIVERCENWV